MHDTLYNFYSSALQCLPATWWMVRVQRLLKYLLKKKNANLSLVRTFKHGLRGELQAESKRGKNEWRGVRARGGREGEDGRGSGNSLLRWVANYCPFWMARSPALAKGNKHTHTHTDKMTRSYRSKRAVLCLILWLLCFKRLASDRPSIFVYAAPPLCASFTPFPLAFTCFLISPSLSPTLSPNSQQQ